MSTARRVVGTLRILLVLAFTAVVLAQIVILPSVWGQLAEETPDLAYLRWPTLTVAVLELLCVQVVIVCTWSLLTLVRRDHIFHETSLVWVDAIVWAIVAAWVLLLGTFGYLAVAWGLHWLTVVLLLMLVAGAVLGLLMVVMRALLLQATTLRTDMEAVI